MFMPGRSVLSIICSTVVMMRLPPGEPVTSNSLPSRNTMRRRHRRERALARARRVGVAADQAVGVGHAGLGGEIVELVVEQDAGAFGDQAEAVAEIERVGVGDGVALAVHHRIMRGVVAFARRRCRRGSTSCAGVARVDPGPQRGGMRFEISPSTGISHERQDRPRIPARSA